MRKIIYIWALLAGNVSFVLAEDTPLSADDIQQIYDKFVKVNFTEEYRARYHPLPLEKNTDLLRWEGLDFPRIIALLEFERFVKLEGLTSKKGLALNGVDPEWLFLPHGDVREVNYDKENNTNDLHVLDLDQKDYDFVMLNQTLEHLYDPIRCLKNIHKHMRCGGILYINVPTNNMLHSQPEHYYTGYTPVGLGAVVQAAGFKILTIGQWGNLEYIKKMYEELTWPDYLQLKKPGKNDVKRPVITWVFAKKE